MKTLGRFSVALVFTFALTLPTLAGEITTGVAPTQPVKTATAEGQIEIGVTGQTETDSSEATAIGSATEIALNLLQSVLSLL